MKLLSVVLFFTASFFTTSAFATEDHGVGVIETQEMSLSYIDHVLSGRIGDRPVYALPTKEGYKLVHRSGGKDFEAVFKKEDKVFKGLVESISNDGQPVKAEFVFKGINHETSAILGTLNGQDFEVQISANAMEGHHFVNPHFELTLNEKKYAFDVVGGMACMGCAVNMSFAILTMLFVTGSI